MRYKIPEEKLLVPEPSRPPYFSAKTALKLIEKIIGEKLDINIDKEEDVLLLLKKPEDYTSDDVIKERISELNTLLLMLEGEASDIR
jgi:hypothetical protein